MGTQWKNRHPAALQQPTHLAQLLVQPSRPGLLLLQERAALLEPLISSLQRGALGAQALRAHMPHSTCLAQVYSPFALFPFSVNKETGLIEKNRGCTIAHLLQLRLSPPCTPHSLPNCKPSLLMHLNTHNTTHQISCSCSVTSLDAYRSLPS